MTIQYKELAKIQSIAFLVASLLGVVFHFVYDWTGQNPIAGIFFPTDESTLQHLKLIIVPIFLVGLWEYYALNQPDCFLWIKFFSSLLGMSLTVVLFYTYTNVAGRNIDWLNITIYFIAMAAAYLFSYKVLQPE